MGTQYYAPQQSAPPQTAGAPRTRPAKWVPTPGKRHVVIIDNIPGRLAPSSFGPSDVVFDVDGGHPWYVPQVIADEIYGQGVRSGDSVEVTVTGRKKTDLLIMPLQTRMATGNAPAQSAPPAGSVNNGYGNGKPPAPPVQVAAQPQPDPPLRAHDLSVVAPAAVCMCAAMCAAVDAVIETQAYARTKGLGVTFGEESVRAIGLSIYINSCKGGAR